MKHMRNWASGLALGMAVGCGALGCGADADFQHDVREGDLGSTSRDLRHPGGNADVYRSWSAVQDSNGGETFVDDPALCASASGFTVVARDSTNRFKTITYQTGFTASSWSSYGTRSFNSKPACASTDAVDSSGQKAYQIVLAGKDSASNKLYASLGQADNQSDADPVNPDPLTVWAKVSDDVYASGPAVSVGRGRIVVLGRKSDNRLYAHYRTLPYNQGSWSGAIQAPALPTGWTLQGAAAAAMTTSGVNLHTVVVRARNSQNVSRLYFTYFKDTGFVRSATAPNLDWIEIPTGGVTVSSSDPALEYDTGIGTLTLYFRSGNHLYQSSGLDQGLGGSAFTAVDSQEGHAFTGGPAAIGSADTDSDHAVIARRTNGTIRWNEPIPGAIP